MSRGTDDGTGAAIVRRLLAGARSAHGQGRLPEARGLYLQVLERASGSAEALYGLGAIAQQVGRPDVAVQRLQAALEQRPDFLDALILLGNSRIALGDPQGAAQAYRRALEIVPEHAGAHLNLGNLLQQAGQIEAAVGHFERALAQEPDLPEGHNSLALLLQRLGRQDEALNHYRQALALRPDYVAAHNNLGTLYRELGQLDLAIEHYEAASRQEPTLEALTNLAALLERANRLDAAQAAAERALGLAPGNPNARLTLTKLRSRSGKAEAARDDYRALIASLGLPQDGRTALVAARAHADLARLCEDGGDYAEAAVQFEAANRMNRLPQPNWRNEADDYLAWVRSLEAMLAPLEAKRWQRPALTGTRPAPIFLVGFPRSGTTLLANALAALPDCRLMDERPVLDQVRASLFGDATDHVAAAMSLSDAERRAGQERYWSLAEQQLGAPLAQQRLIDKMPLNLLNLWLVAELFPEARVVVTLRDPRDVCLSCFTTLFRLRPGVACFPSLEASVALYQAVMAFWLRQEALLPLDCLLHRYEDLVRDLPGELRRIVEFLGLPWNPAALDPATSARRRFVATPSYDQVVKPIYDSSIGRWRHYREMMAPHLEHLQPFLERFGYA